MSLRLQVPPQDVSVEFVVVGHKHAAADPFLGISIGRDQIHQLRQHVVYLRPGRLRILRFCETPDRVDQNQTALSRLVNQLQIWCESLDE